MRDFSTPAAFRAAVESRLRDRARTLGVSAYVLRRQAALERLMVRLDRVAPGRWALKGGLALETRLGAHARVSVDLDADHAVGADAARADLQRATVVEAGDHFDFALTGSQGLVDAGVRLAVRYALDSSLAGRPFEPVQVDVTLAPPDPWDAQPAERAGILRELGLGPIPVLLIPVERQIAEKLHAYTRIYKRRGTTQAKDLVDLLLVREHEAVDVDLLQEAIVRVFDHRGTHPVPASLPRPPRELARPFGKEAARLAVVGDLNEAARRLAAWIDPVLQAISRSKERERRPAEPGSRRHSTWRIFGRSPSPRTSASS